jgi:hypothetical protein
MPFYVVCFNRIYGLEQAVKFAERSSLPLKIIILDMGSSWAPFIKYRDSLGLRIVHFEKGIGPRDLFGNGFLVTDGHGPFFFSDGDLDYSETEDTAFENMKKVSEKYPWFPKIGLALKLDNIPSDYEGNRVKKWEKDNWLVPFSRNSFLSGVDTTIAFYPRREERFYYRPSLRLAKFNSVIHYPWLERQNTEESIIYAELAQSNISSGAAGDTPSFSYKIKHRILILAYFATCIPLKFSLVGSFFVKLLAKKGTIQLKQSQ